MTVKEFADIAEIKYILIRDAYQVGTLLSQFPFLENCEIREIPREWGMHYEIKVDAAEEALLILANSRITLEGSCILEQRLKEAYDHQRTS